MTAVQANDKKEKTMSDRQKKYADAFRQLQQGPDILVLPNAWDVMSAKIFEQALFQAVGTTSCGIAASMGYLDGEHVTFTEMIEVIERIVRNTTIPVNADIEAGYGKDIAGVIKTVRRVIQAGVAGINLEDATRNPDQPLFDMTFQCKKLQAIREAAASAGIPLVINARVDTYLVPIHDPDARFNETVKRANAYRQAGADCIFIPGSLDAAIISRLVAAIDAPLNVLASPVTPSVPELKALGVARLSIGAGGFRSAMACVGKIAAELAERGTYEALFSDTLTKAEVDSLLKPCISK
jgi:2-methylisocitrate lyase-like PEP mutase family enzyme